MKLARRGFLAAVAGGLAGLLPSSQWVFRSRVTTPPELRVSPIIFDDAIITAPLLHGELFPLVQSRIRLGKYRQYRRRAVRGFNG